MKYSGLDKTCGHSSGILLSAHMYTNDTGCCFNPLHISQDKRILEAMVSHLAEEERRTALSEEVAWAWHLEREKEMRERKERDLTHQRRLAESQKRFNKQVCGFVWKL